MYENEIYNDKNVNSNQSDSVHNPYYDYTSHSVELSSERDDSNNNRNRKTKDHKKHGFFKKAVACIVLGLLFGSFAGAGFYAAGIGAEQLLGSKNTTANDDGAANQLQTVTPSIIQQGDNYTTKQITYVQDDISDMVQDVMPAMVSIINNYTTTGTNFWGQTYSQPGVASGSGIIVGETDTELLIASNNHVVEDATSLEVTFIDGSIGQAVIKGTDADMDLAVIAVPVADLSEDTKAAIKVAVLGDSDNLKLGEPVVAIGNALGYGQSVTNGIVSALNREVQMEDGITGTFIQTNAAINPGNSGGALLNINGEVIGINSSKIGGSAIEGMGYAIPINAASPILSELMERVTRVKVDEKDMGYMGISMQTITADYAKVLGMPKGVYVMEVTEGSAAEKAGILPRDIIVKFDGQKISIYSDLQDVLQYYKAGDTTTVTVKRLMDGEYQSLDLEITLGNRPNK